MPRAHSLIPAQRMRYSRFIDASRNNWSHHSQFDVHQDADEVLAVALRTAIGIQRIADHESLIEPIVLPIGDAPSFVLVEYPQRRTLADLNGRAGGHRVHPVSHRRETTRGRELVRIFKGTR